MNEVRLGPAAAHWPTLAALVRQPHLEALSALGGSRRTALEAVAWCSAHLAAVDHVLYPAAQRALPGGRNRVRTQRAVDHRLQNVLWQLDRRLTGDVHLADVSLGVLEDVFRAALEAHEKAEQELVQELCLAGRAPQEKELVQAIADAMRHAPSRPHPDTPHGRFVSGPAYWLDTHADQLRDTMDGRSLPVPHAERAPRPIGRWASYLMGRPYPGGKRSRKEG